MLNHFGEALTLLRRLRGMTQTSLALRAKVGRSQLSRYEQGQQLPHLAVLERLLDALEMNLTDLVATLETLDRLSRQNDSRGLHLGVVPSSIGAALRAVEEANQQLLAAVRDEYLAAGGRPRTNIDRA